MNKVVKRFLLLVVCLLLVGCTDKKPPIEELLSYDSFLLYGITTMPRPIPPYGALDVEEVNHYHFIALTPDALDSDSVEVDFDSDIEFSASSGSGYTIEKNGELSIFVEFPLETKPTIVPIKLSYVTISGEKITKSYVLDFTQEPYMTVK